MTEQEKLDILNQFQTLGLATRVDLRTVVSLMDAGIDGKLILLADQIVTQKIGRRNVRIVEKTLYDWQKKGWNTVEMVAEGLKNNQPAVDPDWEKSVLSILSLSKQHMTNREKEYIVKWSKLGFDEQIISMAYERTHMNTGKLAWAYMDKILENWHAKGLRTAEEIKEVENQYRHYKKEQGKLMSKDIDLRGLYDAIMALQRDMAAQHHDAEIGCLDYKVVKALGATYELQDYLANRIAQAVATGELEPDPEE